MKIAILGFGRMGAWFGRVFSESHRVAVYEKERAITVPAPLERLSSLEDVGPFAPDLLLNAVTLGHAVDAFASVEPYLPRDCILCDVASVKGKVADYYRKTPFRFASVHPMFGPTHADLNKLAGENAVIISESCAEGRRLFEELFRAAGVRIFEYSFDEHDRMMAYSLSTPFIASLVFASCVDAKAVPGTTFTRHMDLARKLLTEDDNLLSEILFNPYSLAEIAKITSRLEFLKHIIMAKDKEEATEFFRRLRENIGTGKEGPDGDRE